MQAQPAGPLILVLKPRCPDPSRSLCRQGVDLAGFEPATNVDGELTRFPAEGSGSLSCGLLHHGLGPGARIRLSVLYSRDLCTSYSELCREILAKFPEG